jgi:hypothetical protein
MLAGIHSLQWLNLHAEELEPPLFERRIDARGPLHLAAAAHELDIVLREAVHAVAAASFAAWHALSAAERIDAKSALSAAIGTTPMLAPSRNTRSSQVKRKLRTASRSASAVRIASSSEQLSSRMPNSSPPRRESVSRQRTFDFSSAPTWPSSASPALWPQVSLTILNWSMSK